MTTLLPHVRLLIERDDTTTVCVDVPAYEQSILEAPYPDGAVQELERYDVQMDDFDVGAAFECLLAKYQGHAATDAARRRKFERARDLAAWVEQQQPPQTHAKPKAKTQAE